MSDNLTLPSPETGRPVDGYIVIAPLSEASRNNIYKIQAAIQARFPKNKFWFPRGDQLHITFAHVITPDAEYPENPNVIWRRIGDDALAALRNCIPKPLAIDVTFDVIEAFPKAIIMKGQDIGSCHKLRSDFMKGFTLPEGSHRPPNIIHTTIVRFYDEMDFGAVQGYVNSLESSFIETIEELRVIHETRLYVYDHAILERIPTDSLLK